MEPPDVTGSSLTLGTAGSRRTVYLLEDNARKLAENNNAASSASINHPTASSHTGLPDNHSMPSTSAGSGSESNPTAAAAAAPPPPPSTFLMFNRISNILGGTVDAMNQPLLDNSGSSTSEKQANDKAKDKKENGKESAVWYEYGCV